MDLSEVWALQYYTDELKQCWIVSQMACANHLTDDEFEQLQGLIKKVELLGETDGKTG